VINDVRSLLGRVGVWSMELRDAGRPEAQDAAAELDALVLRALWFPGLDGRGVFDDVGHPLRSAPNSAVVVGVLGIWGQDTTAIGDRLHQLDTEFGPRTISGFGVSNAQAAVNGGQVYGNPIEAVGAFLDRLDDAAHPIRPERRLLGANGPKMAELAASRTAGIHPFLVTPQYSVTARDWIGHDPLIAPHLAVVFESDAARARAIGRDGIGMFIGLPAYQSSLRRIGFSEADVVPGGSDRLIDAVVAWGSPDDIRSRIQAHLDAGADHVAVNVLGAQDSDARPQWRELAGLVPALT
jgi:probable F420-dependent oxidoreductase